MESTGILDKDQDEKQAVQSIEIPLLWKNVGRFIAAIQMLFGLTLSILFLMLMVKVAEIRVDSEGISFSRAFFYGLGRANMTLVLTLAMIVAGFLFWKQKSTGWVGTFFAMGLAGIVCLIFYFFDEQKESIRYINEERSIEVIGRNEFYLLGSVIAWMLFIILVSKNFRMVYKATPRAWTWVIGTIAFLVVDTFIMFWWR